MTSAYFSNLQKDLEARDIIIKSVTKIHKPEKIILKNGNKFRGNEF